MASMSDEVLWQLIHRCDVPTLKGLLGQAGVPHNVKKLLLQQRLFYCIRLGLEVLPTEEEEDRQVALAHRAKLDIGGLLLPHPLTLDGWETTDGNLPDTSSTDIENYFKTLNQRVQVPTGGDKALSEGNSLFLSKHVQNVSTHKINNLIGICFIQGYVIPSMRVHADSYFVWVQLYKDSGAVRMADCHCIAGVGGMCKHIAALLYHIVQEVSAGKNKACTQLTQQWHKPSSSRTALTTSAFLADIKTPKASRRVCPEDKPRRDQFDPRPLSLRGDKSLADFDLTSLASLSQGKAAVLLYADKYQQSTGPTTSVSNINHVVSYMDVETTAQISPIMDCFKSNQPASQQDFLHSLTVSDLEQSELEASTRSQAKSELWMEQRKARMTASIMHDVIVHIDDNGDTVGELATVVENVMGYNTAFHSKATEHGKRNEAHVLKKYKQVQRRVHRCMKVLPSGLWVYQDLPVIAASPDGMVQCDCCPKRLLEIKCPYRERFLTIEQYARQGTSITKAKHRTVIIMKDDVIIVNDEHRYYTQIQTQLMCTGLSSCDLAIGTMSKDDNFAVFNIVKNEQFCSAVEKKATIFFSKVVYPELQTQQYWLQKKEKEQNKLKKKAE